MLPLGREEEPSRVAAAAEPLNFPPPSARSLSHHGYGLPVLKLVNVLARARTRVPQARPIYAKKKFVFSLKKA